MARCISFETMMQVDWSWVNGTGACIALLIWNAALWRVFPALRIPSRKTLKRGIYASVALAVIGTLDALGWLSIWPTLNPNMVYGCMLLYVAFSNRHLVRPSSPKQSVREVSQMNQRLVQLRLQLLRLNEKERLGKRLERAEQSQAVLDRYEQRFHIILVSIEQHLIYGDSMRAERIITLFSRHLRHILQEGATPFLSVRESLDHVKTHLELMGLLTAGRFFCDIDDGMLDHSHFSRYTESLSISPWAESMVWPFFEWAERSIHPIEPMQLVLDTSGPFLTLECVHPTLTEQAIDVRHRVKLLGEPYAQETRGSKKTLQVA